MRDVLTELLPWWRAGKSVGVGTVVATWSSAPRPAGASMLVGPEGEAVGSVSGGCVESDVFDNAMEVMRTGEPKLLHYGITDDQAWEVGLPCGGEIDVFVEAVE